MSKTHKGILDRTRTAIASAVFLSALFAMPFTVMAEENTAEQTETKAIASTSFEVPSAWEEYPMSSRNVYFADEEHNAVVSYAVRPYDEAADKATDSEDILAVVKAVKTMEHTSNQDDDYVSDIVEIDDNKWLVQRWANTDGEGIIFEEYLTPLPHMPGFVFIVSATYPKAMQEELDGWRTMAYGKCQIRRKCFFPVARLTPREPVWLVLWKAQGRCLLKFRLW